MQQTARFSRSHAGLPAHGGVRLHPVIRLSAGEIVGLVADPVRPFEETVRFGPAAAAAGPSQAPLAHLTGLIEAAASLAHQYALAGRPIHVPVPMAAVMATGLAEASAAAAERAALCPQEICLDIADSGFLHRGRDMFSVVRTLRAAGLLVAIDARRSFDAPLSEGLRLLVDRVSVRLADLERSADLEARVAEADASGMTVMVEGARWRDGDWLAGLGVTLAIGPALDS